MKEEIKITQTETDKMAGVEAVELVTDEEIQEIKDLDDSVMPEQMQYDVSDLRESFDSSGGVHILVKDSTGKIMGYLTSVPKDEEYEDLCVADPEFFKDESSLYIESILVKDGDLVILNKVFKLLLTEAGKRGYKNISMHARVSQGLSDILQKRYGAKFFRRIENWYDFGEPFDYLELDLG
jgi:hypothetical protein